MASLIRRVQGAKVDPTPKRVDPLHERARRRRRDSFRKILRRAEQATKRIAENLKRWNEWAKAPPEPGYGRGKLRRENVIRVQRGEKPIPYPERRGTGR